MQPAFLLWPTTFAEDKLLVFGIAYFTKKPLHRAGACYCYERKNLFGAEFQKEKVQRLITGLDFTVLVLATIAGIKNGCQKKR